MQGIFANVGTRFSYKTNIEAIQNVFFDMSYWKADLKIQESRPHALNIVFGTKIGF